MTEDKIIENTYRRLNSLPGFTAREQLFASDGDIGFDGVINIRGEAYETDWYLQIKARVTAATAITTIFQTPKKDIKPILSAQYISPEARKILQDQGYSYVDMAGNMFLNDYGMYVLIERNKTARPTIISKKRAFTQTGLKVVFHLLTHPEDLNQTYRFISQKTNASLDTINKVIRALLIGKYIIKSKKDGYIWINRRKLFQEWVDGFGSTLRPKIRKKRYRPLDPGSSPHKIELPEGHQWGGEKAAEILTGALSPVEFLIYTGKDFNALSRSLNIIPDPDGPIVLAERFWPDANPEKTVDPILIYADLVESGDARLAEIALEIYEQGIRHTL